MSAVSGMPRVLVVEDGFSRGALAAVRGLAAEGWVVGVASPRRVGLAASSRWTAKWHRVAPTTDGLEAFVTTVAAVIESEGYELVFGAGDAELLALSAARGRLSALVPYAPHEIVVRALDKLSLLEKAQAAGIAVPRTVIADEAALEAFGTPVVVKARLHADPARLGGDARLEAVIARNPAEAAARVAELRSKGAEPLLQELVSGRLIAHTVVVDGGAHVVARLEQEADATWPADMGASVRARTVPINEELAACVDALVADLGWFGLAELQLLARDGERPRLIDLNGRFYGSLALALAAGVNFPAIWAALATGRKPPPVVPAAPGIRYHWLEGDLRRARRERSGGVLDSRRYARGATAAIWRRDDPWPGARYALHLAARALRKVGS